MAALSSTNPTLLDIAKRSDPDGKVTTDIVEILNETNEILLDMTVLEGNLPTGHRTTIRTGLPSVTWRKFNQGVQPSKSTTAQITHNCGMLEAYAEVDAALVQLNGNTAAFRMSEEASFIEAMGQEMADTLFYGNEGTEPEAFTGLSPYYNSLSAANQENIIRGGGSGADNASIWLVGWSARTVHGIVPKGSKAGLQMEDKGKVTIENADGSSGRMEAFRTHYRWDLGLALRDWRYVVRIANIDKSLLTSVYTAGAFTSGAHLPNLMYQAIRRLPSRANCRPVFYMSRDIVTTLQQQLSAAVQQSSLDVRDVGGVPTETFQAIPIRRVDALSADEAVVS